VAEDAEDEGCFILRVGITIEHQLQVRDVFSIRLETRCPVSAKTSIEIQHLRSCDYDGPKRPIETQRLFVAENTGWHSD
jgi:hypothetical protein